MPQFNALNECLKKQYEETLLHGKHLQERTVVSVWKAITQFENATGRVGFDTIKTEHAKIFKSWMAKQKTEKGEPLSPATQRSMLAAVREFFLWLRLHPKYGRKVDARVAEYLNLSNNDTRAARAVKPRKVPTPEQMGKAIAGMPTETAWERRDRAVIALAALTSARDGALISFQIGDIDVEACSVWQDLKHVNTKFRKGIATAFVPINPAWESIVLGWVAERKAQGATDKSPLFPMDEVTQNPDTLCFERTGLAAKGWNSASPVRRIFKEAFERVGLPYFHPHTCRHMIIHWAMENCDQIQFKAISQNIGHESAMTTYNTYGALPVEKQMKLVRGVTHKTGNAAALSMAELLAEIAKRTANSA